MFVVLSHGQQFSERINSAKEEIEDRMLKFRECERETKTKAFSKEGLKQPSKQTPQDVTVGYVAQEQEKRQEVQEAFRRQISELTHEIEECECEINKEKARKRNQNQVAITRYETFIKHHHWHIKNLELVLRQIDNHIISPFDVSPILDGVADYIQNYRNPDFFFDDSVYEDFDLLSAPPASEPTSSYTTNENGERVTTSNYSDASKHQTIIGKLSPDFYGGFSTDLSWKNIDLSAVFGYSVGGDIYNYDRSMYDSDGAYVNYNQMNLKEGWNRWEKPGDIATHPKAEYGNKSQSSKGSSRYLEDASYLRLRSLTLGYTLPWKIQYVDNIRLSFSGENLFVLSGFSGVDPELPAEVGNKYKAGSVGVAISPYPQARKFMFGLNVTF